MAMDGLVDKGKASYEMRLSQRCSWAEISVHIGLSSRGCLRAARIYAMRNNLPWPIQKKTKGGVIYSARKVMSWSIIANRYNQSIEQVKRLAYKYAKRNDLDWPIRE